MFPDRFEYLLSFNELWQCIITFYVLTLCLQGSKIILLSFLLNQLNAV